MKISSKQYIYKLSNVILKWSLVYMIVLFFLEDLKPFLVSTVFSPHWILLILVISLVGVLIFASYGHDGDEIKSKIKNKLSSKSVSLNKFDIWFFRIVIFGFILLWLPQLWNLLGFLGFLLVVVLAIASEKVTLAFFKK